MGGNFLVGANLPWIRYGCDFGANAWQPEGGLAAPGRTAAARDALAALADNGASVVRWFLLCDGRAGIDFDADGGIRGLDARLFPDLDAGLNLLAAARLSAIFVLTDFTWFGRRRQVNGVALGGRSRLIADPVRRSRLLERVFRPILQRYGREPIVRAWDVINEPDWIITRLPRVRRRALSTAGLREFVRASATLVHEHTRHAVTVGSARPPTIRLLGGLGLDFYQVHWYDKLRCRFDLEAPARDLASGAPVVLGEFPTCRTLLPPVALMEVARESGYAGALGWSACATDRYTDPDALHGALAAFRPQTRD